MRAASLQGPVCEYSPSSRVRVCMRCLHSYDLLRSTRISTLTHRSRRQGQRGNCWATACIHICHLQRDKDHDHSTPMRIAETLCSADITQGRHHTGQTPHRADTTQGRHCSVCPNNKPAAISYLRSLPSEGRTGECDFTTMPVTNQGSTAIQTKQGSPGSVATLCRALAVTAVTIVGWRVWRMCMAHVYGACVWRMCMALWARYYASHFVHRTVQN